MYDQLPEAEEVEDETKKQFLEDIRTGSFVTASLLAELALHDPEVDSSERLDEVELPPY